MVDPMGEKPAKKRHSLACPLCQSRQTYVTRTTVRVFHVRRERVCADCGRLFVTRELVATDLPDVAKWDLLTLEQSAIPQEKLDL
jgi:transcriptional regulator NrdR family protein